MDYLSLYQEFLSRSKISLTRSSFSPLPFISLQYSVTTKSNKCTLFSTLREPSVNRKDWWALTLVWPTRDNLVIDPPTCTTPRQLIINNFSTENFTQENIMKKEKIFSKNNHVFGSHWYALCPAKFPFGYHALFNACTGHNAYSPGFSYYEETQ